MMVNPFNDNRLQGARSALINMVPDEQGRYTFGLMCQYTRMGLHGLDVGDLVAVENYTPSDNGGRFYSVLSLSQVSPSHFAAQGNNAYPGHIFESMRSIKEDWETQQSKPMHLTTIIEIKAVSTGFQFLFNPRTAEHLPHLVEEQNLPMIGAEIRPLSMEMVNAIINQDLENEPDSPFSHKKFDTLNVKLDQESLLTTHFGIFGFTGVGKSNLVSSMVSSLCFENENPLSNFLIFDPNDEYLGLFLDRFLIAPSEATYVHIGTDSLHSVVARELGTENEPSPNAMAIMNQQLRLPPTLQTLHNSDPSFRKYVNDALVNVFHRTRVVMPYEDVAMLIRTRLTEETPEGSGPQTKDILRDLTELWSNRFEGLPVNLANVEKAIAVGNSEDIQKVIKSIPEKVSAKNTVTGIFSRTQNALKRESKNLKEISPNAIMQTRELIQSLTQQGKRQVIIITGRRDSEIKHFASFLGNSIYDTRRREISREPFITFMFDEADLFIPQTGSDKDTAMVRELCVTLARRGRKFGLGLGIATQRSSLLDTEVMANLHTYFVSKLPRSDDRERVAEAFGISKEQLTPTFTFRKGNWLIISHDATGLKGVPIPTQATDANSRIYRKPTS